MKNSRIVFFQVTGLMIVTVAGAGFASGREISLFFFGQSLWGYAGMVLSMLLLVGAAAWGMQTGIHSGRKNLGDAVRAEAGRGWGAVTSWVADSFTFMIFCVMLAGMAETLSQVTGWPGRICLLIFACICGAILLGNLSGMLKFSLFAAPLMIAGMAAACLFVMRKLPQGSLPVQLQFSGGAELFSREVRDWLSRSGWLLAALLYASYNAIPLAAVMCETSPVIRDLASKRKILLGALASGAAVLLLLAVLMLTMLRYIPDMAGLPMPVVHALKQAAVRVGGDPGGRLAQTGYAVVLLAAMLTTALSAGLCLVSRLDRLLECISTASSHERWTASAVMLCACSIPFAGAGFMNLVAAVYPLYGVLGCLYFAGS
ncbi:MAG TPA: hypothetical protein DD727_07080, partial [Clostridiales bacterium]|nr:hypothetical protein [Clostridiales bacterium]